ncbi:DUF3261 domain-containing protein [Schlegelella sp. S2-27]|uniref:DUF3261 domain-containing protein n=2 Tax=Caldimonas mangrovi TaxID=2944811 RepID=A0ABT0YVA7_9BURK|nr:DUF3261 domain-containing protein [Caldimonas mangrovi]
MLNLFRHVLWALPLVLAGCASGPKPVPELLLRLHPSTLGTSLALTQRLEVTAVGRRQAVEALLEADAQTVRLALLDLGRTGARLSWDGEQLTESRADWWPAQVSGSRILSDLQLALWPVKAIRDGLPPGWTVEETSTLRELRYGAEAVARVRRARADRIELDNLKDGYRLTIESQALQP